VSISILEYELELSENIDNLESSRAFSNIMRLIQTGKIHSVHIDVMRPPMIPDKSKFSIPLIKRLYEKLRDKTALTIHLMVDDPLNIIEEINRFTADEDRANITVIVQVESFSSEDEAIKSINTVKSYGYNVGVSLNLPTPKEKLTDKIARLADVILLMTVPMGSGGQKYYKSATRRIKYFSTKFPDKIIKVDGGINSETVVEVWKAGAKAAVIGSYITVSDDPERALLNIERSIKSFTKT